MASRVTPDTTTARPVTAAGARAAIPQQGVATEEQMEKKAIQTIYAQLKQVRHALLRMHGQMHSIAAGSVLP